MNILLQPASGNEARRHFKDTISNGVFLSTLKAELSLSEYKELLKIGTDPVQVWGFRPEINNDRRRTWVELETGDTVLFYANKSFYYLAEVHSKVHNPRLARILWGPDRSGRLFEYIYFIKNGREVQIPFDPQSLGYASNMTLMGARLLSDEKKEIIQKQILKFTTEDRETEEIEDVEQQPLREYKITDQVVIFRDQELVPYKPSFPSSVRKRRSGYIDFDKTNKRNSEIGNKGEEFVIKHEKEFLISKGRSDLAAKVKRKSLEDTFLGYDILSFDEDGREKRIEVKSTTSSNSKEFGFHISWSEIQAAKNTENYFIYLVLDVDGPKPMIVPLKDPFKDDKLHIEATKFKVKGNFK